jgi:SRSO17 transposase
LAATIKTRWICEQAHQQLKEELGLDHFEGRSWPGLHRHALMAMIAYAFSSIAALQQQDGKKESMATASTDVARRTPSHRRTPRSTTAAAMPHCRKWICNARRE